MNGQDFKALLDSLNRISEAIEGKADNGVAETVKRFSAVYVSLQILHKTLLEIKEFKLAKAVGTIMETYSFVEKEVLNESN